MNCCLTVFRCFIVGLVVLLHDCLHHDVSRFCLSWGWRCCFMIYYDYDYYYYDHYD